MLSYSNFYWCTRTRKPSYLLLSYSTISLSYIITYNQYTNNNQPLKILPFNCTPTLIDTKSEEEEESEDEEEKKKFDISFGKKYMQVRELSSWMSCL